MEFEQSQKIIEEYLEKYKLRDLGKCYKQIVQHIDLLQNDKELTKFNMDFMVDQTRVLMKAILSDGLDIDQCRFIEAFSELIFNWNANVEKNPDIDLYTQIMKRMVGIIILLQNNIALMKKANDRWHVLTNWAPPAYDMSKAYLESLLKKYK